MVEAHNMRASKLNLYLQLFTALAVLIGLGLVIVELRQSHTLARVQLSHDGFAELIADQRSVLGENFSSTLANACRNTQDLSGSENWQLNAWYLTHINQIYRIKQIQVLGQFDYSWQAATTRLLSVILDTEHGRDWFKMHILDPDLQAMAKPMFERGIFPCGNREEA